MAARIPPKNGYPVSFRQFVFGDMVRQEWGQEWAIPDIVYEMSNGRKFESTDLMYGGVYAKTHA